MAPLLVTLWVVAHACLLYIWLGESLPAAGCQPDPCLLCIAKVPALDFGTSCSPRRDLNPDLWLLGTSCIWQPCAFCLRPCLRPSCWAAALLCLTISSVLT